MEIHWLSSSAKRSSCGILFTKLISFTCSRSRRSSVSPLMVKNTEKSVRLGQYSMDRDFKFLRDARSLMSVRSSLPCSSAAPGP